MASLESLKVKFVFTSELPSFEPITPAALPLLLLLLLLVPSYPVWTLEMLPVGLPLPTLPGAVRVPGILVVEGALLNEVPLICNKLENESVKPLEPPP